MKKNSILGYFSVILILLVSNLSAQTGVGKIAGTIVDADTKEPLIGANVIILNTDLGAATDINGEYYILNITPGNYDLKASYVGYGSKTLKDIRIVAGITREVDIELTSGISLDEIVITDQKLFEEKATNTVKVVGAEEINKLPVRGVSNIASLQSGVVVAEGSGGADGNATLNVRGGRGNEVLYIIDGIPQNNILTGANAAQVSNYAIEQMSFQVGGYEAKYGQAQSGIINVTTKSGSPNYNLFADVLTSSFTDDYGYNIYSLTFGGPFIPGNAKHTLFISAERGWYQDADPSAIDIELPSIGKTYTARPNNSAGNWRFSGKTYHSFGSVTARLGANVNTRNGRTYIHSYVKNNSDFFPEFNQNNYSFSGKISHTLSNSTFYNITAGYRSYYFEQFDPHFKDDLYAYGDSSRLAALGATIDRDGLRVRYDENNIFFDYGRVNNLYSKNQNDAFTLDLDLTSQIDNHLMEIGFGGNFNIVRFYSIGPVDLSSASTKQNYPTDEARFESLQPSVFGYDVTGRTKTSINDDNRHFRPKTPIFAYAYLQDRFELEDLVLNLGVRMDYFDTRTDILANPALPYAGGSDPLNFDDGDFIEKEAEIQFSPRIGLGFPVTENTVFHAQYGRFVQQPALTDLYSGLYDYLVFKTMSPQYVIDGRIKSEETVQYEIGLRQSFGSNAALNVTAFYKNIKGLVNRTNNFFQRTPGGESISYIAPNNSDFGTTKGIALSLDVYRLSYFNFSLQYTYSLAEGTGSSTNSSQTAIFRNLNGEAPKVIAPLDFDQRHTGVINLDFSVPKGEGGIFENFNANTLISLASGRPYTPLDYFDILSATSGGSSTTGYVNSRYAPGTFRVDLKVEKGINIGNSMAITPYVWVENLFDAANPVNVYRSTGSPYTTGFLNTDDAQATVRNQNNPEGYTQDYIALERDPDNFGIPRLIKLGLKLNFSSANL